MNFKNERLMMSKEETRKRAKELLNENQVDLITKYMFLEQQVKKQKEVIDKVRKLIEKHYYKESDDYYDYFTEGVCLQDGDYNELEDILKEVE